MQYNPNSVLSPITKELNNEINWVKEVKYVEQASVPVVKVTCKIDFANPNQPFSLPNYANLKYKTLLEQPFNIDITQMTDHHNGLECVRLV